LLVLIIGDGSEKRRFVNAGKSPVRLFDIINVAGVATVAFGPVATRE